MNRYDTASQIVSQAAEQMIGQLIEPAAAFKTALLKTEAGASTQKTPCYRLEKLLDREVGKRTFLATDVHSNAQVVIKLLLYCPDPQEKEIEEASSRRPDADSQIYDLSAMLPYLDSFEVETELGIALALVKPYSHQSVAHQSTARQSINRANSSQVQRIVSAAASREVTIAPQTAYADFRIKSAPDKFSIQCLESRICEGIVSERDAGKSLANWLLAILATITFVGGAVAATGSVGLGIVVAALLPIFFRLVTAPKRDQRTTRKRAIIRFGRELNGRTSLSLTTALMSKRDRTGKVNASPTESRLHYSRLSVKNVTIAPAFFFFLGGWNLSGAKLTFTFYNHDAPSSRLCVVGSYQEIRWIHRHLLQWSRVGRKGAVKEAIREGVSD
ncbi:MAG: hypothetical protein WA949_13665 [Phormidesmis sp.]